MVNLISLININNFDVVFIILISYQFRPRKLPEHYYHEVCYINDENLAANKLVNLNILTLEKYSCIFC